MKSNKDLRIHIKLLFEVKIFEIPFCFGINVIFFFLNNAIFRKVTKLDLNHSVFLV